MMPAPITAISTSTRGLGMGVVESLARMFLRTRPHPALPRKRGREDKCRAPQRDLLLPPLAGEGWDGGRADGAVPALPFPSAVWSVSCTRRARHATADRTR